MVVVRVGVTQTPRELEIELSDSADRDALSKSIDQALSSAEGVLWLEDRRGRKIGLAASKVAYIEIGAPGEDRRVGFGAP